MTQYEGEYLWHFGTLVAALVDVPEKHITAGCIYQLGHPDGRDNRPNYWVVGDDGVLRVVAEAAFTRARMFTKREAYP